MVAGNSKVTLNLNVDSCVANAHIVTGLPQRKGVNPNACQIYTETRPLPQQLSPALESVIMEK